jgi:hypothetical protein
MNQMLNKKDIEVIMHCWKKGTINHMDLEKFYLTPMARRQCINHLEALGVITEKHYHYQINREKFLKIQNEIFKE